MDKAVLYLHGKGGSAAEAEQYRKYFNDADVIGIAYEGDVPWVVEKQVREAYEKAAENYKQVSVIANSIGAYYAMNTLQQANIEKAWFISPIVDMERLILDMLGWAHVTEQMLQERGEIATTFGETLSWDYLCYVRTHPIVWTVSTEILYASGDHLTAHQTIEHFARAHKANLTVMEDGEHWFHTKEQLAFLDCWMQSRTDW